MQLARLCVFFLVCLTVLLLRRRGWLDRNVKVVLVNISDIDKGVVIDASSPQRVDSRDAHCVFPLTDKFSSEMFHQETKGVTQFEIAGQQVTARKVLYRRIQEEGRKEEKREDLAKKEPRQASRTSSTNSGWGYNKFHGSWRTVNKSGEREAGVIPSVSGEDHVAIKVREVKSLSTLLKV